MQTVFAVDLPGKASEETHFRGSSVAISAKSEAVQSKIESFARRAGVLVVASGARYDVLLVGVDESTSQETLIELAHSSKVCAIWTSTDPPRSTLLRIFRSGIAGILSLESTCEQFQAALRAIQSGLQVTQPQFIRAPGTPSFGILSSFSGETLTDREQQVLGMMAEGLSNKEISARLNISAHTVKFHISSILGKLGATSRTEAVSIGVRTGRVII